MTLLPEEPDYVESCFLDLRNLPDDQSAEARAQVLMDVYRARLGAAQEGVTPGSPQGGRQAPMACWQIGQAAVAHCAQVRPAAQAGWPGSPQPGAQVPLL
jgi:hypothetical protein